MLAVATTADAKLTATLSTKTAHPGDIVTLTTAPNSQGVAEGKAVPVYLLLGATDPLNNTACQIRAWPLGTLLWDTASGAGTLSFKVPAARPGDHLIEVLIPNVHPACWPVGSLTVLALGQPPTDTAATPTHSTGSEGLPVAALIGVIAAVGFARRPGRRSPR